MSLGMHIGRIINGILKRAGFRLVTVDPASGQTFAQRQTIRALTDLSSVYNQLVFRSPAGADPESLALLARSMFTGFGTGLYLIEYLRQSRALEGDVCEFGVGQGAISAVLAHGIRDTEKNLWLFDSFAGFPEPSEKDTFTGDCTCGGPPPRRGALAFPQDMVMSRLAGIGFPVERTRIVKGYVEETTRGGTLPEDVCFAYVDLNLYEATLTALLFLDRVIVPGGIILIDDYDHFITGGVRTAADDFFNAAQDRYERIIPRDTRETFCMVRRRA